ncbi:TlpA disulfide reductase family protein [Comamonas testosteroni]|uniref:Redoxin domain protein n=1 Tax=Comamonas testosteroni (strain DSM 14576 / KF-1) TaxID=399795 RepID=B7WXE8_COMTK|nr:TlpA disulfide reductase family protein [Comamonas testosteroni]EED65971.1 Redoxin domain protein [Comamonas testosteroni KF-1]WQG69355.1 TlpA disulfide reductase family protein [Comamonas testosteroni]
MTSIGPLPIRPLLVIAAFVIAWLIARWLAKRQTSTERYKLAGSMLYNSLLVGLLTARLAHIAQWHEAYLSAPMSIVAIGDGGFLWWVGVLAGLAFMYWRTMQQRDVRKAALTGAAVGLVVWLVATAAVETAQRQAAPLPNLELLSLEGQATALHSLKGKPIVLNLWASWCPPCRREMPAFVQAQKQFPNASFVMINQGESPEQVVRFLQAQGLNLSHVLLDPNSSSMKTLGARGLPSTYFFDAQGQLVYAHVGELTLGAISSILSSRVEHAVLQPKAPTHHAPQ